MAIRDDQLLIAHFFTHPVDHHQIANPPYPVPNPVFVPRLEIRAVPRFQQTIDFTFRIAIQHEELPKMGTRRAQQFEAVGFGLGQGLLVPKHHTGRIILDPSQGDNAPPLQLGRFAGSS